MLGHHRPICPCVWISLPCKLRCTVDVAVGCRVTLIPLKPRPFVFYNTSPRQSSNSQLVILREFFNENFDMTEANTSYEAPPFQLDPAMYCLDDDERAFMQKQTGFHDEQALKAHIFSVQERAYKVSSYYSDSH